MSDEIMLGVSKCGYVYFIKAKLTPNCHQRGKITCIYDTPIPFVEHSGFAVGKTVAESLYEQIKDKKQTRLEKVYIKPPLNLL